MGINEDYADVDSEIHEEIDDLIWSTIELIGGRKFTLRHAYPFLLCNNDEVLTCTLKKSELSQAVYIIRLVLLN